MSKEHIVPKSLWSSKPANLVTVPAHVKCNQHFSSDNEYFQIVMANVCHDLGSKAATDTTEASIKRSMLQRPAHFRNLTKDLDIRPRFAPNGRFVGFQPSFSINDEIISRVLQNIVRCIYYDLTSFRLTSHSKIYVQDYAETDSQVCFFEEHMLPSWARLGGDVFAIRFGFSEQFRNIFCLLRFYGVKTYFAISCTPSGLK